MKNLKRLFSLVLALCMLSSLIISASAFDGTGNMGSGEPIELQWATTDHNYIIDLANYYAVNKIEAGYKSFVKSVSHECDTNQNYKAIKALHGRGNYIATQKFLRRCTTHFALYNKHSDETILQYAQRIVDLVKVHCGMPVEDHTGTSDDETEMFEDLVDALPGIINAHKTPVSGQTYAGRCKYTMYGLIAHFYGDLTAHRPLVPTTAISSDNTIDPATELDPDDFPNKWTDATTGVQNQTMCFRELPHLYAIGSDEFVAINEKYTDARVRDPNTNQNDPDAFYGDRVQLAARYFKDFMNYYDVTYGTEDTIWDTGSYTPYDFEFYDDYVEFIDG